MPTVIIVRLASKLGSGPDEFAGDGSPLGRRACVPVFRYVWVTRPEVYQAGRGLPIGPARVKSGAIARPVETRVRSVRFGVWRRFNDSRASNLVLAPTALGFSGSCWSPS